MPAAWIRQLHRLRATLSAASAPAIYDAIVILLVLVVLQQLRSAGAPGPPAAFVPHLRHADSKVAAACTPPVSSTTLLQKIVLAASGARQDAAR